MNGDTDDSLKSALADVARGELLEAPQASVATHLAEFAATLPELYASTMWSLSLSEGEDDAAEGVQDIVLYSPHRIHIAQRVPSEPGLALISISDRTPSIGLILAEARDRLTRV